MATAVELAGGCLSTDLRRFLASGNKAHGAAGHQLLRKLLSICTGKCGLSSPRGPATSPQEQGEEAATPRSEERVLRPRRQLAQTNPQQQQRHREPPAKHARDRQQRVRAHQPLPQLHLPAEQQQQQPAARQPGQQRWGQQQLQQQRREEEEESALCADLLDIVRRESGVVLALALHATHIWSQGSPERTEACIRQGLVPVLLQVLGSMLVESPATPTAAYAASMAVILLRTLTRSGENGMAAFMGGGGVGALLSLLPALREDRALCLLLYLLSDVTRRSGEALTQAVDAGGVALVVACLGRPIGESTKFAALLINRWCLLAPLGEQFRGAGALDSLLCVLRRQQSVAAATAGAQAATQPEGAGARTLLSEVSAYSLSALSILGQEDPHQIRALLVGCPSNLAAVTRAMTDYQRSFQGTGFPHALLSSLLEGAEGAALVAQLASRTELLSAWLSLRQIGWELVQRAAEPDMAEGLAQLPPSSQGNVAQSLTLLLPHSDTFLRLLASSDRLEPLTKGAVAELLAGTPPAAAASGAGAVMPLPVALASLHQLQQPQQPGAALSDHSHQGGEGPRASPPPFSAPPRSTPGASAAGEGSPDELTSRTEEEAAAAAATTQEEQPQPAPAGESQLQRGVSIIPEAIVELEQEAQQQEAQQQEGGGGQGQGQGQQPVQQEGEHGEGAGAPSPAGLLSPRGAAPCTAALRRLLAVWGGDHDAAPQPAECTSCSNKRGREEAGAGAQGSSPAALAPAPKRARFAFCREDVNVRRYDTLTFVVGGREFYAVGFVLEAHSALLASLLGTLGSLAEALPIPCVAGFDGDRMYELFGWAVEYCYTGGVQGLIPADALDLWVLAEFLQIDGLQRECEAVLASSCQPASQGPCSAAPGAALLGTRYALGLAYPSGSRLRLAVAREVLSRLASQAARQQRQQHQQLEQQPPARGPPEAAAAVILPEEEGEEGGVREWDVGPDVAVLLAAHPCELAADMAEALALQLQTMC